MFKNLWRYSNEKWADKSTRSYDILDFKSYIKNLESKYLVVERHMLQYLKLIFKRYVHYKFFM